MPPMWFDHADAIAIDGLTYAQLRERARGGAERLLAEPTVEFVATVLDLLDRRAGTVLVDPRWGERERATLSRAPREGLVLHTSGTTGAPRPVVLTAANLAAAARATNQVLGLGPGDRWLCPVPLSHVAGLLIVARCALAGAEIVLGPAALTGATYVSLVPTQLKRLLDAGARGPAQVILGGAPAARELKQRAREAGVAVRVAYGLTQTSAQVTLSEPGDLDTAGRPLPGAEIEIAPDGEIVVRGPMVARGEVRTGDLGRWAGERLVVTGRKDDLIVSGGENVMPEEVEAVLLTHPAVLDAGVVGRPDPEWGQRVSAHVVLRPGATADAEALRAHCAATLARFKVPKTFTWERELPRTGSGKLLRRAL